jgi:hypothetical protein
LAINEVNKEVNMRNLLLALFLGTLFVSGLVSPAWAQFPSVISSNFNGTPIPAGRYIWFNSVLDYSGPSGPPVTIFVRNSQIEFTANNIPYVLAVPNAEIRFSSSAPLATTTFNAGTNTWVTTLPFGLSGNEFLTGLAFQVPVDLPGGINPVRWRAEFSASLPDICFHWKWAAAVYTTFSGDHDALGVKPIDANQGSQYPNSDHAGTPENFKDFVVGGARGGGGSNYTGSYSGTDMVCTGALAVESSTWGAIKANYER